MSVLYIKGMEMPKNCEECFLVGSCTGKHWEITEDDMGYKGEYVKDNCPLIEVPEPSVETPNTKTQKSNGEISLVEE